jgi:hypothetical protein
MTRPDTRDGNHPTSNLWYVNKLTVLQQEALFRAGVSVIVTAKGYRV